MSYTIPEQISSHKYGGILGSIWSEVHNRNGIVTIIFCGKRGKGKSYSMMEWARILDCGPIGETRFEPGNVRLDPVNFLRDLTGKYPVGKVHVLDDAGLHMYKSDALTDILKKTSKVLQNIRYKNPIIMMSLPHFEQLMKDARTMSDIYIEMQGVDLDRKVAWGNIQKLSIAAFSGDLFRTNILQSFESDTEFDVNVVHWEVRPYAFNKPPDWFVKSYEGIKRPILNKINEQMVNSIAEQRDDETGTKFKRMELPDAVEYVKKRLENVVDKRGKIVTGKIMLLKDKESNKALFSFERAKLIRQVLRNA